MIFNQNLIVSLPTGSDIWTDALMTVGFRDGSHQERYPKTIEDFLLTIKHVFTDRIYQETKAVIESSSEDFKEITLSTPLWVLITDIYEQTLDLKVV